MDHADVPPHLSQPGAARAASHLGMEAVGSRSVTEAVGSRSVTEAVGSHLGMAASYSVTGVAVVTASLSATKGTEGAAGMVHVPDTEPRLHTAQPHVAGVCPGLALELRLGADCGPGHGARDNRQVQEHKVQ